MALWVGSRSGTGGEGGSTQGETPAGVGECGASEQTDTPVARSTPWVCTGLADDLPRQPVYRSVRGSCAAALRQLEDGQTVELGLNRARPPEGDPLGSCCDRFVSPRGTRVELEDLGDIVRVRLLRPDEPPGAEPFSVTLDVARDRAFAERAYAAICCALDYTEGAL